MTEKKRHLVFLASNEANLEIERYEIERELARNNMLNIGFAFRDDADPYDWELVREQIELADLFILLIGSDYGAILPTGISYLHREYVHAQASGIPTLAFIKKTSADHRLETFHNLVSHQTPCKWWHLKDELLQIVRTQLMSYGLSLSGGWQPIPQMATEEPPKLTVKAPTSSFFSRAPLLRKHTEQQNKHTEPPRISQLALPSQVIQLLVGAKVYKHGNLTQEFAQVPMKPAQLLKICKKELQQGCSAERLRYLIEDHLSGDIKQRLLKQFPDAHAVDDIRLDKVQFNTAVESWEHVGAILASTHMNKTQWRANAQWAGWHAL